MLPAADLSEILANLSALNLQPSTAAAVLGAVLAPLLRTTAVTPQAGLEPPSKPYRRPRVRPGRAPQRKKPKHRAAATPAAQNEHSGDAPRQRAARALAANPGVSLTRVAEIAGVSRSTVVNARDELTAEARKPREPKTERRERAQRFLKDALAHGPKQVSVVEEAAAKARVDPQALEQARTALGIVTSRGNTGGVQAVQWSLPG
jgi:hypothetical protein